MAQHKQRKETAATQAAARKRVAEAKKQAEAASREEKLRRAQERAAQARERAAARKRVYVVQPGDSLSKIAKKVYNDASRWTEIFEANKDKIANPNIIRPGQELCIP